MTQEVDSTENASAVEGTQNQTQGAPQVQPNSPDVEAIVAKVADRLFPEFEKRSQSVKDRRIAELMKGLEELKQSLTGEHPKPEPVLNSQEKATDTATNTPAQDKPVGKQADFDEAETVILKQFGLSQDDPAVVAAKALDPVQRILEYGKVLERRAEQSNPSAVASLGGKPAGKEALTDELLKLQESDPLDSNGRQAQLKQQLGW